MNNKKKSSKNLKETSNKYRLVILTDNTFEEKLSFRLSLNGIILFVFFLLFFCFLSSFLVLSYSPLKEHIPGRSSSEVQKSLIDLAVRSDSLEKRLKTRAHYLNNIMSIVKGSPLADSLVLEDVFDKKISIDELEKSSSEDSVLRTEVESIETGTIFEKKSYRSKQPLFLSPISGVITDLYNKKIGHYGIDIVAKENEPIISVLEGSVIISHWTNETGYVIGVQHKDNFISFYKHNSVLLKKVGDFVLAGEQIAIIGNSGQLSSGPHLHFELWHNGEAVNPQEYINF